MVASLVPDSAVFVPTVVVYGPTCAKTGEESRERPINRIRACKNRIAEKKSIRKKEYQKSIPYPQ
jgi:hypothetical protein